MAIHALVLWKNGSGIGLAVVKKIMQDHNGNIELENNKNNIGAAVPNAYPITAPIPPQVAAEAGPNTIQILLLLNCR